MRSLLTLSLLSLWITCFSQTDKQKIYTASKIKNQNGAPVTPPDPTDNGIFNYVIPTGTFHTSAGIFAPDNTLVRTLWYDSVKSAGTYIAGWDGKNDLGVTVTSPLSQYYAKIIRHNVGYAWDGTMGNNSDSMTGDTKFRGYYHCMKDMAIWGTTSYYCTGYSEGSSSMGRFSINDIHKKTSYYATSNSITGDVQQVCTDGTRVYWGVMDSYNNTKSFVIGHYVSDNTEFPFSAGLPDTVSYSRGGRIYTKAIAKINSTGRMISGLGVQLGASGYLFVSRKDNNLVYVLNKVTGAAVTTISMTAPGKMKVYGVNSDSLWIISGTTVNKHVINSNGTISGVVMSVSGLVEPLALDVSPNEYKLMVADGTTRHNVKVYDNYNGNLLSTIGETNGYATEATVSNNKFYFNDIRVSNTTSRQTFVHFQPDSSYWISDPGNLRVQKYNSSGTFVDRIQSLGATYSVFADPNNKTRVWVGNMEFSVGYGGSFTPTTNWTLVKNWGFVIPPGYSTIKYPTTMSNGRTYAFSSISGKWETVEFPSSGVLRFSGLLRENILELLAPDGALQKIVPGGPGGFSTATRAAHTGFNGSGWPTWSTSLETLAITPTLSITDPNDRISGPIITSANMIVWYNPDSYRNYTTKETYPGFHLGFMKRGGNKWISLTELATFVNYRGPYPKPPYFEIGNQVNNYAGSQLMVIGRHAFIGYHGEYWKNGQTNWFNHYLDNGLPVGQFGTDRSIVGTGNHAEPWMAGNALTPTIVLDSSTGNGFIYHGDESDHSGPHRIRITGLASIDSQTVALDFPVTPHVPYKPGVNLMAGLPFDSTMTPTMGLWSRFPTANTTGWSVKTSNFVYDRKLDRDIIVSFNPPTNQTGYYISAPTSAGTVTNDWEFSGEIGFNGNDGNRTAQGLWLEMLDGTGKTITTLYLNNNTVSQKDEVFMNGYKAYDQPYAIARDALRYATPFRFLMNGGILQASWNGGAFQTITKVDGTSNLYTPTTVKVRTLTNTALGSIVGRAFILNKLWFVKDVLAAP